MSNKITFRSNINIGHNGAENDGDFLFNCFVDHYALAELRDIGNSAMFILGSTGIGKTALIRMIERLEPNSARLELHDMSMSHISNSDTINFMKGLDVDLSLLFQSLWRHVICIEYIKSMKLAESSDKLRFHARRISDAVTGDRKRRTIESYFALNEKKFWNTIDENVIEFTTGFENNVSAEMGIEIEKNNARAGYARSLSREKKTQLQQRAKKFVDSGLLAEQAQIISVLGDHSARSSARHFLLIDGIDDNWVDVSLKYQLVQALFEAVKAFQKIRNFKIIVALRNDVFERMVMDSGVSKGQLEKYDDFIIRLKWTKPQLFSLADKRINHLFKWRYSSENVHFPDIFKQSVDSRKDVFSYLVERTLNRPRDVINFISSTLQAAEGKSAVSKNDFLRGEGEYSNLRLKALRYEWQSAFPGISVLLNILSHKPVYFGVAEFNTTKFIEELYDGMGREHAFQSDDIYQQINSSLAVGGRSIEAIDMIQVVFSRLNAVGAVGLKISSAETWQWAHETGRPVPPPAIDLNTKVTIHPMLHFALHNVQRSRRE